MLENVDKSWKPTLKKALEKIDKDYLLFLEKDQGYFPEKKRIFQAFLTLPKEKVKFILFGQDPYPRKESASGYAFIDGRVKKIFSSNGFSKEVNKATSLRNFLKMMLVARGDLECKDLSQAKIAQIEKKELINSIEQLRKNFEAEGILLLNTALIFTSKKESKKHIKNWENFIKALLEDLKVQNPKLILFGNFAKDLKRRFSIKEFETIELEHPFNSSFVCNQTALDLFGKMDLLRRRD
jgi:uracil-DNA glycosylase